MTMERPRLDNVQSFVEKYAPCTPAAQWLKGEESSGGAAGVASMTEAWDKSPFGSWLEWLVRLFKSDDAVAMKQLETLRFRHFGPVFVARIAYDRPPQNASKESIEAARQKYHSLREQAEKDYAAALRAAFPNPFSEGGG
jgi:hypothetical protein